MKCVLATLLTCLVLGLPQARADLRGQVHVVTNPDAPRAEWRRLPLPGAFVAVTWQVTIPAPAQAVTSCRYSELARSDAHGEFVAHGPNFLTAMVARTSYVAYAAGLEEVTFPHPRARGSALDITLARSRLAPQERLSRIAGYLDVTCALAKLDRGGELLGAFHLTLLEEARSLRPVSQRGRLELRSIEAAARRSTQPEEPAPGPMRAVVRPSAGALQRDAPVRAPRP